MIYSETDIWSKKTTINNQFIYFRSHLSLFDGFIQTSTEKVSILEGYEHIGYNYLSEDNKLEYEKDQNKRYIQYVGPLIIVAIFGLF